MSNYSGCSALATIKRDYCFFSQWFRSSGRPRICHQRPFLKFITFTKLSHEKEFAVVVVEVKVRAVKTYEIVVVWKNISLVKKSKNDVYWKWHDLKKSTSSRKKKANKFQVLTFFKICVFYELFLLPTPTPSTNNNNPPTHTNQQPTHNQRPFFKSTNQPPTHHNHCIFNLQNR